MPLKPRVFAQRGLLSSLVMSALSVSRAVWRRQPCEFWLTGYAWLLLAAIMGDCGIAWVPML